MVSTRTTPEKTFTVFNIALLAFLSLSTLYPLYHVIVASLSDPIQLDVHRGLLLRPLGFTFRGYQLVFKNPSIVSGYFNTIIYVTSATTVSIIMTSLGAYALSKRRILLTTPLIMAITFTMFFSGGLIPLYILVMKLGLIDSRLAMVLPTAMSTFNLLIMRTSFAQVPDSLEDSARIDGANDLTILWRVVLPVSKAVLAVMILFYAVEDWNDWFQAAIYLRGREKYPLQLILREILVSQDMTSMINRMEVNQRNERAYVDLVQYAAIVIATVPILFVYPFLQKHFVKGVLIGSIKG